MHRPSKTILTAVVLSTGLAAGTAMTQAHAQDAFLGQIMMFGGNFCPRGWLEADGQLLPIAQNSALFSLYGTIYGGDGRTTFALPDLRGRVPMHTGDGPGLTPRPQGSTIGAENATLNVGNLPPHSHSLNATSASAGSAEPAGNLLADTGREDIYESGATADVELSGGAIGNTGGGQAFSIMQPSTTIRFCVATVGVFPSRN